MIRIPTARLTTIVRVASTVPVCGRSIPTAVSSAFSSFAIPRPTKSPVTAPIAPMISASSTTAQRICRRAAPSVRSVANSRVRWVIVIDSVLAMTKLPTKSAIPPKASSAYWMTLRKLSTSFLSSFAWAAAFFACAVGGRSGWISESSFGVGTPAFDWTRMRSSRPTLPNSRWAVGMSNTETVEPPIDETAVTFTSPEMRNVCSAPREVTPIASPMAKWCLSAVLLSIAICPGPDGHEPATSESGLKR